MPRTLALVLGLALAVPAGANDYANWPLHQPRFDGTGGGGVVIDEYNPVVVGDRCITRFTATQPDGRVFANHALFEAEPVAGGAQCTSGQWVAVDGSATGTTPYRVFIRDGLIRRAPD